MAGISGPAPKPDGKRARSNPPTHPSTELDGRPVAAPPMPKGKWLKATRDWWAVWKGSPQAKLFLSTDWMILVMLLPMVDAYYRGDLRLAGEIRMAQANLGATPKDRLQLRWRLSEMKAAEEKAEKKTARKPRRDPRLKVLEGGS